VVAPLGEHPSPLLDNLRFDEALRRGADGIGACRDALRSADEVLRERFFAGTPAAELVHQRAALVDSVLTQLWYHHFGDNSQAALVAVGGYGRAELHPGSDIDILILLPEEESSFAQPIERFLTFLWDVGLEVGHSVRTPLQCVTEAARDITVATTLQEARLLAGTKILFDEQRELCGPKHIWPGREFFEAKLREQTDRHHKYNDTAYNLEPNVKEGPGGLRDIQVIGWVAKRHFNVATLHDLVKHEFLTESEFEVLKDGQDFLWQIRFGLHALTGRREDRLLFDHQRGLARFFGYRDDEKRLAVEHFMKRYYRTIMELNRLNEMLLQLFQEEILLGEEPVEPQPLNRRFQVHKGFLEVTHPGIFQRYPFALMELFLLMAQHPELKGVRANTIRLIREHHHLINDKFRDDLRCRTLFMEILRQPQGVTHEMRRMNRYGVLAAYLPVFGAIVGQMQHDLFHVYTVDEHTMFVLRNLRRFTVVEYRHEFPLCSSIIQRVPKPELLYLAALFHDVAKGRGGDHSTLGAHDAEVFCRHHGLSEYDTNMVAWLVRNHLVMSRTSQRSDTSDPEVVAQFAEHIGDQVHLDYLYLLTVADVRATSPNVWNAWKDALLRELYHATTRAFRRGLANPIVQSERVREVRSEAGAALLATGLEQEQLHNWLDQLGDEYFLRYSVDEIVWHTQAILDPARRSMPLVLIRPEANRGGSEIFVYAQSDRRMFANLTAILEQLGLTIVDARIISSHQGDALDSLVVLEENGEPIADSYRLQEILEALQEQLGQPHAGPVPVTRHVPRQLAQFEFPPAVTFSLDRTKARTTMEVTARDRPGLLSRIAEALQDSEVIVHNAKIATFGERAEDIFFLSDADNQPLTEKALQHLQREIIKRLED